MRGVWADFQLLAAGAARRQKTRGTNATVQVIGALLHHPAAGAVTLWTGLDSGPANLFSLFRHVVHPTPSCPIARGSAGTVRSPMFGTCLSSNQLSCDSRQNMEKLWAITCYFNPIGY